VRRAQLTHAPTRSSSTLQPRARRTRRSRHADLLDRAGVLGHRGRALASRRESQCTIRSPPTPILLPDLLPEGTKGGHTERYRPVDRMNVIPAQRHYWGRCGTGSQAGRKAHNPKVAGSNPAPATNVRPAQRPFLAQQEGPLAMSIYQGCTTPIGHVARRWCEVGRTLSPAACSLSVGGHGSGFQRTRDRSGGGAVARHRRRPRAPGGDGSFRAPPGRGGPGAVRQARAAGPVRPGRGRGLDRGQPGGTAPGAGLGRGRGR